MMTSSTDSTGDTLDCQLCILGAGVAGLNALFVASQYLKGTDRVVLVDRRGAAGGMWLTTYSYVRLHQPHPMFTAGNIKWDWDKPSHVLASRSEVVDHLTHCLDLLRSRVDLNELYAHEVLRIEDPEGSGDDKVLVHCRSASGAQRTIRADRVISAYGFDVPRLEPLPLSSRAVLSTVPERLEALAEAHPAASVYVVGGGKTGMDTATMLLQRNPARKVVLLSGKGTIFSNRATLLPRGAKRWLGGKTATEVFEIVAREFDGSNEDKVYEDFRRRYALSLDGAGEQFFFGLMSPEEIDFLKRGLDEDIRDYLTDVVDGPDGPVLTLRSGESRPIEPGAILVNCTGHIFRRNSDKVPYLSESGRVLSINSNSVVHFLTTVSAYFLTHLWFLGKLGDIPFYAMDYQALMRIDRKLLHITTFAHSFLNLVLIMTNTPFKILDACALDFDRWYPLPRRMKVALEVMLRAKGHIAHCQSALDKVQARTGIQLGPLSHLSKVA